MIYKTCRCGKCESWSCSMPPAKCTGCKDCGTNYYKEPIKSHNYIARYDAITGISYRFCKDCYEREQIR